MSSAALSDAGYMRKAERALEEARLLLREQKTEGACNRAYYAMHDAAHAALLATAIETPDSIFKTHHCLIAEFGKKPRSRRPDRRGLWPRLRGLIARLKP